MRTPEQFKNELVKLSTWIDELREAADRDEDLSYSVYNSTVENEPFVIVGGWSRGFSEDFSDVLYVSKSNPAFAMCIKIAINDGPYAYTDYDLMDMPVDDTYEVEDTNIALEREDVSAAIAEFYLRELERMLEEHNSYN